MFWTSLKPLLMTLYIPGWKMNTRTMKAIVASAAIWKMMTPTRSNISVRVSGFGFWVCVLSPFPSPSPLFPPFRLQWPILLNTATAYLIDEFRMPQFDYPCNVIFTDSAVAFGGYNLSEQLRLGYLRSGYEAEPGHARQMASFLTVWRLRFPPTAEPGPGRQMRAGHFDKD